MSTASSPAARGVYIYVALGTVCKSRSAEPLVVAVGRLVSDRLCAPRTPRSVIAVEYFDFRRRKTQQTV